MTDPTEQQELETPKKRSTGSGNVFICTVCEDGELSSFASAKRHYIETHHAISIGTWSNYELSS